MIFLLVVTCGHRAKGCEYTIPTFKLKYTLKRQILIFSLHDFSLQDLYKSILLSDLSYALERKVEQEL